MVEKSANGTDAMREPDHFEVVFDPIAKTAILVRGQKFDFLKGPFKDYTEARRAAMSICRELGNNNRQNVRPS
ncbi:hypothetical protein IHQ71_00345 [Rhizobium sp. TH2]|uniref:hypothetical protein n=1 Tax=Rhizobium sp. TH2 TaxID=2775403 RepID=UPI002157275F|nr:hypothetical protein [Rhizobium sp. TH2]UVC09125.1 hypothetical protein IHQ71_00345 [Rhizobium sp. TH2]